MQDAYLSEDKVMCALLERAGGKKADDPAIKEKLPALLVSNTYKSWQELAGTNNRATSCCPPVRAAIPHCLQLLNMTCMHVRVAMLSYSNVFGQCTVIFNTVV